MKHFLPLLFALLTTPLWSQTGNGVVILTDASHTFTPTTVDSTTSFSFQLVNEVGVSQTVFFGALDAPFAIDDNAPVEIPSQGTIDVTVNFTPADLGTFTDTLSFVGSVFGSSDLILSGDGIQVVLVWEPSTLEFDTTAIGQTNSQTIALTSSGNGDATITDIAFSSPIFSIDSANSAFTIAEGSTENLTVVYAPINAGAVNETMTFSTNDPNNPTIEIALNATAISEVSGEVCDITWTAINSPYTLTGDITVPEGCTLTLEPGTEVIGSSFAIENFGTINSFGEAGDSIIIECESLILNPSSTLHCENTTVIQSPGEITSWIPLFTNENALYGAYQEDFEDGEYQGWSFSGSTQSQQINGGALYMSYNGNGQYFNNYFESPQLKANTDSIRFDVYRSVSSTAGGLYWQLEYRINNNTWTSIGPQYYENSGLWISHAFDVQGLTESPSDLIQFRVRNYFYDNGTIQIDNFVAQSNSILGLTGVDNAPVGPVEVSVVNSTVSGGIACLADSIDFFALNSIFTSTAECSAIAFGGNDLSIHLDSCIISGGYNGLDLTASSAIDFDTHGSVVENATGSGMATYGDLDLDAAELDVIGNGADGLDVGEGSNLTLYGVRIQDNGARGIGALAGCMIDLDYVLIDDNGGRGIDMGANGQLSADYLRICDSGEEGIYSASSANISHSNIGFNTGTATVFTGNNFHTLDNSILWGNNTELYKQVDLEGGILSTSYSLIQGLSTYGVGGAGQYSLGEGLIEVDPLLADEEMHLQVYSPCVDGAQPWTQDQHMPYGLGGVRADMGMYGGPANAYWGGEALPDGSSVISAVSDSPQDQGNTVGLTFSGSYYDNSDLVNNVTHYAFWRHYDPTGQSISTLDEGNWELLGTMPSQSFAGYAYQAATLGNTNDTGPFTSCYTVVAHTDDPDTYWYSNVMCGESVDNLAPDAPDVNGMVLEEGGAQISWADPGVEDYGYTRILGDNGFEAEISADTLVVDASALPGSTVTYTATHFDVNGNESDPADVTLVIGEAFDVIPLNAGWNLISLDREPENADLAMVFADLVPGNLEYVTGFDAGVSFYDPNGLPFLNTLSSLSSGLGYWVKVAADDTLRTAGTPLGGGYLPTLDAGWNLVAYTADGPLAPETFFADLIADGDLDYVTGFDAGVQVFDPNGLPFLNSLTQLRNGYGYWVKTASDFAGMELADGVRAMPNPNYVVLNGTSNLGAYAGQVVDVVTDRGDVVAQLPILEGGHLMTTAVYGAGLGEGGLADGTPLYLEFAGQRTDAVAAWTGDMAHIKLDVALEVAFSVFPNPTTDRTDLRWEQLEAGLVTVELFDAQGRRVASENLGSHLPGAQQATIAVGQLAPGAYTLRLLVDGRTTHQSTLTRAE